MEDSARRASGTAPGAIDLSDLSRREQDVLALLCRGKTRAAIAAQLYRSPKTIDNHCTRIYHKLGVQSQAQLVSLVYEQGLIKELDPGFAGEHAGSAMTLADRAYQAIGAIDRRLAGAPAERYFGELVAGVAEVLGTELAGISEFNEAENEVVVIVGADGGNPTEQMECPVESSACGRTYARGEFACDRDARSVFPDSEVFRIAQIDSYAGVRLDARAIGPVGCLWAADRKPMEDLPFVLDVLRLLRRRVSSELALQIAIDRLDEFGQRRDEEVDLLSK